MDGYTLTPRLQETLAVFGGSGEPLTTPEVTEALDLGRRAVYARLEELADEGYLETKKVGASARVWWRPRADEATVTAGGEDRATGGTDPERAEDHEAADSRSFCMQRAMDEAPAGITVTDPSQPDNPIIYANKQFQELTGYSASEAEGRNCRFLQGPETDPDTVAEIRAAIDNQEDVQVELRNYRPDGTQFWNQVSITPVFDDEGDVVNYVGFQQDITDRKRLERERRRRVRQQEVVAELGQEALEDHDLDCLLADATRLVAETLGVDYCKVLELDNDRLHLREGVGWDDGKVGEATVSAVADQSQAAHTLASEQPVVVENLATDTRFSGPALLTSHDVTSGISTIIGSIDDPWGILAVHDTDKREFSDQDVTFVQSVANTLATAINDQRNRAQLQRQARELATLVNLNTIVHETTESVIAQSTRDEIEQALCDELAASESYEFAWLARIDSHGGSLELAAVAGDDDTTPEVSVASDRGSQQESAWTALREHETQVRREPSDPVFGLESAVEAQAVATIPIVHEETLYGVVGVGTSRSNAFGTAEQTVISRLGEVVGHAIAAVERKRALVSEEVVELTFRIPNVFEELPTPDDPEGTITLDEIIPVENDEFLIYGTVTPEARQELITTVETVPGWESVSFRDPEGETTFELELSDHPVLSTLLTLGGSHRESIIEDGEYQLTVRLAPNADIRRLVDAVRSMFPGVEMVTRRQITRTDRDSEATHNTITESLTDRQQSALRAAYHGGLFEWPRDSTAEEIADSLGIAPSTFHQHLRKAERKVFDSVLSAEQVAPMRE